MVSNYSDVGQQRWLADHVVLANGADPVSEARS
jgi:hypothetical protein